MSSVVKPQNQSRPSTTRKRSKKPATKRSPRRERRPTEDVSTSPRTILLLGLSDRADAVRNLLLRLGLDCRVESSPRFAIEHRGEAYRLVVIVPPLADISAEDFCIGYLANPERARIPILVVGSSSRQARALYSAGASALFDWPTEQAAFVRTVLRLAGPGSKKRTTSSARDLALAARAQERIRAQQETFGPLVKVRVQRSVVMLAGEVDAVWKISELADMLSSMPGVDEVVTSDLRVPFHGITDRTISRSVRNVLRSTVGLEDKTFSSRVANGTVTLTGSATSRREMDLVVHLIEHVAGVRSIENLVVVSPPAKARDGRSARHLSRLLATQFPNARIDVSVFGGIAVLAGRTRSRAQRHEIESLVRTQPGVDRVVSKLD
jgi:osmotically-inducible protein OsmY